ncbi:hypothetical protein KJZ00_03355 [Cutibacterium avidum]|uniref:hypothetical protein n=1 Tax=Cutibacterium avidum TaxID=33010 RepID=UPI000763CADA|nr:hypothetical protein [Cutibacterium avidum]KXA68277.1 hypothetical protein HMPREF3223_00606 [Cutibacterium avidum]MCO6631225.1 hypothetical protein [Cutibacterium avidum]MCO6659810.1 hypothetical protein [Cutibacterium avidum]MCO6664476.1 hypothetical protein [Cutibacterium avidum]MCT1416580.1 hypothetical protein [Cutibacterium avidum]
MADGVIDELGDSGRDRAAVSLTVLATASSARTSDTFITSNRSGDVVVLHKTRVVCNNRGVELRFTQAARKHRIGRAHAIAAMASIPIRRHHNDRGEIQIEWVALDDRGIELEIVAVEALDTKTGRPILLVLHVMPTGLRRMAEP